MCPVLIHAHVLTKQQMQMHLFPNTFAISLEVQGISREILFMLFRVLDDGHFSGCFGTTQLACFICIKLAHCSVVGTSLESIHRGLAWWHRRLVFHSVSLTSPVDSSSCPAGYSISDSSLWLWPGGVAEDDSSPLVPAPRLLAIGFRSAQLWALKPSGKRTSWWESSLTIFVKSDFQIKIWI